MLKNCERKFCKLYTKKAMKLYNWFFVTIFFFYPKKTNVVKKASTCFRASFLFIYAL